MNELVRSDDFKDSHIILLAEPLTKTRRWISGEKDVEIEGCKFDELKGQFKMVILEEILRSSSEICKITKSTQNFVQDKKSIFKTDTILKQRTIKHTTTLSARRSTKDQNGFDSTSIDQWFRLDPKDNSVSLARDADSLRQGNDNSDKVDKQLWQAINLDQLFDKLSPLQNGNTGKEMIVNLNKHWLRKEGNQS